MRQSSLLISRRNPGLTLAESGIPLSTFARLFWLGFDYEAPPETCSWMASGDDRLECGGLERILAIGRFLLLPGGLVLAAFWLLLESPLIEAAAQRAALAAVPPLTPAVLLAIALLLALWFHQLRLATALTLLLLLERGVVWLAATSPQPAGLQVLAVAALLANLLWIGVLPTRSGFSLAAMWPFAVLAASGFVLAVVAGGPVAGGEPLRGATGTDSLLERLVAGWEGLAVPWALAIITGATVLALSPYWTRMATQRDTVDRGIVWSAFASILALVGATVGGAEAGFVSSSYWLAAGVLGLLTVFEASHRLAYFDELTGLPARRAFEDALGELRGSYAIAMVDVDHFKRFNDRHGHAVGDQVLRAVASQLEGVRGGGRAYRYGGEEFSILFPGLRAKDALGHVDDLRSQIESSGFSVRGRDRRLKRPKGRRRGSRGLVSITVSAGVSEPTAKRKTPVAVLKAADGALYRAKKKGRNQVCR